jgi:hypothetical protein
MAQPACGGVHEPRRQSLALSVIGKLDWLQKIMKAGSPSEAVVLTRFRDLQCAALDAQIEALDWLGTRDLPARSPWRATPTLARAAARALEEATESNAQGVDRFEAKAVELGGPSGGAKSLARAMRAWADQADLSELLEQAPPSKHSRL